MLSQIQPHHHQKMAYVYLRQSTMGQVRHHQESTARQYALKDRALSLGWQNDQIRVLDADLGLSGTQTNHRQDFKTLVADVSLEKVGAVFALEASRLSRSCSDWHRLLEICAFTGTLLIDEGWLLRSRRVQRSAAAGSQRNHVPSRAPFYSRAPPGR